MINSKRFIFNIFLFSYLVLFLAIAETTSADVRVHISGGFENISSFREDKIEYISLSELVDLLDGSLEWEIPGIQVKYKRPGQNISFLLGSPFIKVNDSVRNIIYDANLKDGQLFIPAITFIPFLDQISDQRISWDNNRKQIRVESDYFNVTDLGFSVKANGLLIEIFLTQAMNYDAFLTEGNWLTVSIRDGVVNRSKILSRKDKKIVYQMKTHQMSSTGQVSMRIRKDVKKWSHKLVSDPPRIQIAISDIDFQIDEQNQSATLGPDDKIDVIVIDAGHGGSDYGAIGQKGTREKDVVLDISKRLAKLIRKDKQFKVVMTRDRDKTVTLQERAAIANNAGADLFISIHANASPKKHVKGWNVFFLAPARNDSARAVEQLENSYFLREKSAFEQHTEASSEENIDPVMSILSEMLMTEFQVESHDFASMVDREFRRRLKTPPRGIDQAGFFVLNKVFTPSVLIESAFISNKTEEKLLKSKNYQQEIAESIYKAIKRFKAKYESN